MRLLIVFMFFVFASGVSASIELNKKVVGDFYETAFNKHQPELAMEKYVGDRYIQHNPFAGDGKKPFIEFFSGLYKKNNTARVEIKRMIAEKDLVVVHTLSKLYPNHRGNAVVDIFRVKNGKIVEHWDVMQPVPEKVANKNTMF